MNNIFVTWRNNEIKIHENKVGTVMFVKSMPENIMDAQLTGNQLTVTCKRHIYTLKRIGKTFAFSLYRTYRIK